MQIVPSKNPEKESKAYSTMALVCGVASLLIWPLGIAGLAFGVRGVILSRSVHSIKYIGFSIVGIILGLLALVYYYLTR